MARKPRVDVEGGLDHVITRANNLRRMFDAPNDYQKVLSLLEIRKSLAAFQGVNPFAPDPGGIALTRSSPGLLSFSPSG